MIKPIPSYLKLVTAVAEPHSGESEDLRSLLTCCRAFERSTGWSLEFVTGKPANQDANLLWSAPVDPGVGASPGHIRMIADAAGKAKSAPTVALPEAKQLASALAGIWDELQSTRKALWQREAELAAGVPVAARPDEEQHLAARLEGVLAAGVESLNCRAAALYLLDAGTSELKLRASWGLPRTRLLEAARPLRGAAADLEALLGHAVVLDDPKMFDFWRVPEACAAAVCVPVSSPTTPLGTLWLFADESREFSASQTNLLEVIAGRLAADLEREMLLREVDSRRMVRPGEPIISGRTRIALPPSPQFDGWEFAGWTTGGHDPASAWCDWFTIASDQFAMVLGTNQPDPVGVQGGTAARLAVRTTAAANLDPAQLLDRLNGAFWAGDQADAAVGLSFAVLDTHHGVFRWAQCGPVGMIGLHRGATRVIEASEPTLGSTDRSDAQPRQIKLAAGDVAVLWGGPEVGGSKSAIGTQVAKEILQDPKLPAAQLAARIGTILSDQQSGLAGLVVRRQKPSNG